MSSTTTSTLLLIGSGPGIGVSTATLFAQKKFNNIALLSRNSQRLEQDKITILTSLLPIGRKVDIQTWSVDITNTSEFLKVLNEVEKYGNVSCVHFNAARVEPSALLEFDENEILYDFKVSISIFHHDVLETDERPWTTTIALHVAASWAIPLLLQQTDKPSFLITSSLLWSQPIPQMFSLSLVKAAQRNLVLSLQATYPSVHIALLNVGGQVTANDEFWSPNAVAKKFWELYAQEQNEWTGELDILRT